MPLRKMAATYQSANRRKLGKIKLPFPELAAILEAATLTKQPNTNPATGGERWHFLKSLAQLRHAIQFYEPLDLNAIDDDEIWEQVDTLLNRIGGTC